MQLRFSLDILIESTPGDTLPPHTSISELAREVGILIEQEKRDDPVAWQGIDVNVEVSCHVTSARFLALC